MDLQDEQKETRNGEVALTGDPGRSEQPQPPGASKHGEGLVEPGLCSTGNRGTQGLERGAQAALKKIQEKGFSTVMPCCQSSFFKSPKHSRIGK